MACVVRAWVLLFIVEILAPVALALGAPGVAQGPPPPPEVVVPEIDPLAVTPEMEAFLETHITDVMRRDIRLRKLQEAIFDPDGGLGITYGTHETYTAAETFEKATGNCLSFTLLFVSMARHLGFEAHFVEVDEVTGWSQRGQVSFNHWHMYAEVVFDNSRLQVDFLPWSDRRYRTKRRIEEPRVRAHYYNNVGAQKFSRAGSQHEALAYFEKALELDATFIPARINLAVAQRRRGLYDAAEANLMAVLDLDRRNPQAASGLATLYGAMGRDADAKTWRSRRQRFLERNPFHHYRLGLAALQQDDPASARKHFKRAIVRQVDEAIFHEQLAMANLRLGDRRQARANLRQALEHADEPARRQRIEAQLEELGSR